LLITHDLGVVANMADAVVVMHRGQVMESGMLADIFSDPRHPYLRGLFGAVPHFDMRPGERLKPLREIVPRPGHLLRVARSATPPAATTAGEGGAPGPLLEICNVSKAFATRRGGGLFSTGAPHLVHAVRDVSFSIARGACFGLVGESGCGKSTLAKIVLRALKPDSGRVVFSPDGHPLDIHALGAGALFAARRRIQYIFQDPFGSLNPRMTVYDIVSEPLVIHGIGDAAYRRELAAELIERVGLDRRHLGRHPHSFSGGQRQRIGIARALALRPALILCDEPVSALDVSIQAEILNLLKDLQAELGLTYLFISHNLAVVDYMASRIAVMCAGRIVEEAPPAILFRAPRHPYTRALLAAVPYADPGRRLDFSGLMDGRASEPHAWPAPFTDDGGGGTALVDVGGGKVDGGHLVRIGASGAAGGELVA
jgi:peptide/nickel transport system ATP-binding protein